MSLLVSVTWRDADGVLTGPWDRPVQTEAEASELIRRGFAAGRRAGGRDLRASVMDDMTTRIIARVRPK